jgi:hypothetical protein
MQKMKNGLQGLLPLTKAAQKNIKGGASDTCTVTYTSPKGTVTVAIFTFSGSCSQQSAGANSLCVNLLTEVNVAGDRCQYDCACDNFNV